MKAEFPDKLHCLFKPARYKVLYGGRGGAKSWGVARALLIIGAQKPTRILCAREFQNSISDSVHKLLSDQIEDLGLSSFYEIQNTAIKGANGTEFAFTGLKNNITKLKSFEGADICWCEEAQTISKGSWDVLIPTIRKEGSEIWLTFNPALETDETYQRFVVRPPANAQVIKIDWRDNPWFPKVLQEEMEHLKTTDPDAWLNVWEGHCRKTLDGAVYANQLREVEAAGRICKVPYDPTKPVNTAWDLGFSDSTAIWLWQAVGLENRVLGYISGSQQALPYYVQQLQALPYVWGTDWLPHDARAKQLGTGKSIEEMLRGMGRSVRITPMLSLEDGINAARTLFPSCYFDADKCADGLNALRHYRYETDDKTGQLSRKPLHDWASHGSDAFRYFAVASQADKPKLPERAAPVFIGPRMGNTSWMA